MIALTHSHLRVVLKRWVAHYIKAVPTAASAWAFQAHPPRFQSRQIIIGTLFLATSRSWPTLFSVDYTMTMAWYLRLLEFLRSTGWCQLICG